LFDLIPESLSTFPSRSMRIDVNSAGLLARASSDGSCLPSAGCASGLVASLLRAYSGGAAPDLHRIPIQKPSRTIYTASGWRESSFPDVSLGGITKRRSSRSTADRAGFLFRFRRAPEISRSSSQSRGC